jgi:hypothetical protein
MSITYTWSVMQMDCYPQEGGETDVVFNVCWTLTGTEAGFTGFVYGAQTVPAPGGSNFTPYDQLTEAQVIGWVVAAMGPEQVAALEANIATQINDQIAPPVVTPPLPWA